MTGISPTTTPPAFHSENISPATSVGAQASSHNAASTVPLPRRVAYPSTVSQMEASSSTRKNNFTQSNGIAKMPDGTSVSLTEKVSPGSFDGKFLFHDPKVKNPNKTGIIEFDGELSSNTVNLKNVFNNSHKKGALDLVIWHTTKGKDQKEFKITGIANDDLYAICKNNYGMTGNAADEEVSGSLAQVRQRAKDRLLDKGWII